MNINKCIEFYKKASEYGIDESFYSLGLIYKSKNEGTLSIEFLEKGVNKNNKKCLYLLGKMYLNGESVDKNQIYAIELLEKSSDLGNLDASLMLGNLYKIKEEYQKAMEYYEIGAKFVNIDCIRELGMIYKNGLGIKQDLEKAVEYFEIGSKIEDSTSYNLLGEIYFGLEKYEKAFSYYSSSFNINNNIESIKNLGKKII
jgi:uncharacterized protein